MFLYPIKSQSAIEKRLSEIEKKTPITNDEDLKQALDNIMADEVKKSLSKVDEKLITECVDMILRIDKIDRTALAEKESETTKKILANVANSKRSPKFTLLFRKPIIICIIAIISSLLILTVMADAMGYDNIIAMGKALLRFPEKEPTQQNGNDFIHSSDSRIYDTVEEMVASEKAEIVYPRELPKGYAFEKIEVVDCGNYLDISIISNENYIKMQTFTNNSNDMTEYTDEINGVKYNIVNSDGLYQAYWILNNNYYALICADKEDLLYTISKIE